MEYICHMPYRGKGATGKKYFFKKGAKLEEVNGWLIQGKEAVCHSNSEMAHRYFARNDDGMGFGRGELTYLIAFSEQHPNEDNGFRFTPEQAEMIERDFPQWVMEDTETLLFNNEFFNASVDDITELARRLGYVCDC